MVMGHVIGASVFNILVIVGGMAACGALTLPMTLMGPGHFALPLGYELLAALAFALMLYPVLRGDLRVSKGEGVFLLVAYGVWIAFELLITVFLFITAPISAHMMAKAALSLMMEKRPTLPGDETAKEEALPPPEPRRDETP
jgi:hypothetical protein